MKDFEDWNWFSKVPKGSWTYTADGISGGLTITTSFTMIVFFGLMTTGLGQPGDPGADIPTYLSVLTDSVSALAVGLFYMIISLIFLIFWYIATFRPDVPGAAVIDFGNERGWIWTIPLGVALGAITVFGMDQGLGSIFAFETLTVFGVDIEPIILILAPVVAIPIVEELFFGGVLTPTLAELLGIIPTAILTGLIWNLWHLGTYSSSTDILIALFIFRFVTTFVILYTKSLMPAIIAHIVINAAGTFLTIG